jgi:hypothetical protein
MCNGCYGEILGAAGTNGRAGQLRDPSSLLPSQPAARGCESGAPATGVREATRATRLQIPLPRAPETKRLGDVPES